MKFGIYDTQDKCWLGNKDGPWTYIDRELNGKRFTGRMQARYAMTVINEQFGFGPLHKRMLRFRIGELPADIDKRKDEITPPITAVQAIKQIEARA